MFVENIPAKARVRLEVSDLDLHLAVLVMGLGGVVQLSFLPI